MDETKLNVSIMNVNIGRKMPIREETIFIWIANKILDTRSHKKGIGILSCSVMSDSL